MSDQEIQELIQHVPLHSHEAEVAVISTAMAKGESYILEAVKTIKTDDFHHPDNRTVWATIIAMQRKNAPDFSVLSVFEFISERNKLWLDDRGGLAWFNKCFQDGHFAMGSFRSYVEIIKQRAQRRAFIALSDKMREGALMGLDVGELMTSMASNLQNIAAGHTKRAPKLLSELMLARTAHYEAIERGEVSQGQPLGFETLQRWIGGFTDGCLYILAARPGVGKSALALQFQIECARQNQPWLFLSQEMPSAQVADRAISHLARVNRSAARAGRLQQEDWARICEAVEISGGIPAYIDDEPALTLDSIRAKAASIKGLRGLVVDYLQLCSGEGKLRQNRNAEIEHISRGLKQLAKELSMPIIALSQLNRAVDGRADKKPIMSDLRDSGSIEQDADGIFFLYMAEEGARDENGNKIEHDKLGFINAKARDGETGEFYIEFDKQNQTMREIDWKPQETVSKKKGSFGE